MIARASFVFAFSLLAVACFGATEDPSPDSEAAGTEGAASSESSITGDSQQCAANPPPNARCAKACPYGYKGPAGTYTCVCCDGPKTPTSGTGEVCGAPPPNAKCASACPGGYKQIDGKPSCQCCAEACGAPPPNARCMACPGGATGYKQINGQPTCECCSTPAPAEVCGGPPPNARCMPCLKGYKQIDGKPSCQCCT